ncbi:MAG: DNA recombination protein RmuC [Elusimicrobiales bacterium]|nr:DNA recombination protein RmuC [Elusimicrobiales bacterium]
MLFLLLFIVVLILIINIFLLIKTTKNENIKELILNENSRIKTEIVTYINSQIQIISSSLTGLTDINLKKLSEINETLSKELKYLQEKNEKKLEEMRLIVDEKLQSTLEKRLSESFKIVNQQLESVYKGIGDMQRLASEVGDLKKVLSNVKQRGIMGEIHLKNILEDIIPGYYIEQYKFENGKTVEFVVKIPSKDDDKFIYLPIDSKFPLEDYQRLLDAKQSANKDNIEQATKNFVNNVVKKAKEIKEYIIPPQTTDFAIMFVPSEGIFAEILGAEGVFEKIRREYNIIITGPTTITAILASLQLGFRTLAIEKKSHEVWKLLALVKSEFMKFSEMLEKTKKKLEDAQQEIDKAQKITFNIGKKLSKVEVVEDKNYKEILEFDK